MIDPDKTQKIPCIKRSPTREDLAARAAEDVAHFEWQAELARQRLRELLRVAA